MLELQALVLCPWEAVGQAGPRRAVLNGAGGAALGFVGCTVRGPRWLRWLTGPRLEVYETEDASLLCTVSSPGWGRRAREVRDAEGRLVGSVSPALLHDARGRPLAGARPDGDGATGFFSPAGLELGAVAPCERGTLLTFTAALEGDPFARMLLLGAALVLA